jgi:hypothetical protein
MILVLILAILILLEEGAERRSSLSLPVGPYSSALWAY